MSLTVSQPSNVDFSRGDAAQFPPGRYISQTVLDSGFGVEIRKQGCGPHLAVCVACTAPQASRHGKSIRFSALLRLREGGAAGPNGGYVHIRMRIDYPGGKADMRDSADPPVTSPDWQYREVSGHVSPGAVSITIWARYVPSGQAWVAAPSFGVAEETNDAAPRSPFRLDQTEDVANGYAGLWWRVDGERRGQVLAFDNSRNRFIGEKTDAGNETIRGATGTGDWARYQIDRPVPKGARNIDFGLLFTGTGTACYYSGGPTARYKAGIDSTLAYTGRRSLRMQFAGNGDAKEPARKWPLPLFTRKTASCAATTATTATA